MVKKGKNGIYHEMQVFFESGQIPMKSVPGFSLQSFPLQGASLSFSAASAGRFPKAKAAAIQKKSISVTIPFAGDN